MHPAPRIENRPEHPYVGKRVVLAMGELESTVPKVTAEISTWLVSKGIQPPVGSLVRYHLIDMPERLEVEVSLPTTSPSGDANAIKPGLLPAGRYATLIFRGVKNGIKANAKLIEWIKQHGESIDSRQTTAGEAFASRVESLLTDPMVEKDRGKWETEIAIKLRD